MPLVATVAFFSMGMLNFLKGKNKLFVVTHKCPKVTYECDHQCVITSV
ncbi:hypothetical protein VCRA2116O29_810002 [Vibrio crassostreae]|nr:hypothetical protein VCRA2116O29_810002 [Vibrio crassostreae]CAK3917565.1 hypothetical protein VCRA2123O74_810009 [Vibrio crassostreae]